MAEQGATVDVALQGDGGPGHLLTHPGQLWRQTEQLEDPTPPRTRADSAQAARQEALPGGPPEPPTSTYGSSPFPPTSATEAL